MERVTLPSLLLPTLDALLANRAHGLPLSGMKTPIEQRVGQRFLRAAHHDWFDIVFVHEGEPRLEWMGDATTLYAQEAPLFAPAVEDGQLETVALSGELLERANFVDARFPELWAGLERGTLDAHGHAFHDHVALRTADGRYWEVEERAGEVTYAAFRKPQFLAWLLRRHLWKGEHLRTRPLSSALRARVEAAVSLEAILRAASVEVQLVTPAVESTHYRLQGADAFRYEDTGEEARSLDWTNPWPEPVFDFLPYPRAALEETLRAPSTKVVEVDYRK